MTRSKNFKFSAAMAMAFLGYSLPGLAADCTQTLNPGANVTAALSSATAGAVICLNAGTHSSAHIWNMVKSGEVTLRSTSGTTATIDVDIAQSKNFRLENLILTGLGIDANQQGGSKNIKVLNNRFTGQALINTGNNSNANFLIDGNSFDAISVCTNCYEGRLQLMTNPWNTNPSGVVVSNNHFGGPGESDGIQIGGYGMQIGPGNVFDGIKQLNYSRHVDSIQLYGSSHTTITGNFFINNNVQIMAPDGGDTEVITHNVFIGGSEYRPSIQMGSFSNSVFSHNTVINIDAGMDKKRERPDKSENGVIRDNIFLNSSFNVYDGGGTMSCTNCLLEHNLFDRSGNASGVNNIIGMPTFVGGASPSTQAGYQLASSSVGYRAALDGNDMGVNYYGSGTVPSPSPTATATATPTPTPTVTATSTPSPSPSSSATPVAGSQNLFASSVPQSLSDSDGAGVNYELGMKFTTSVPGQIQAIRFYKSASESGTHVGKIYSASGALLAQVTFSGESASGWQQQALATPLAINANTTYVVSVNSGNSYYVHTEFGLSSQAVSGNLRSVVGSNGVYGPVGSMPNQSWHDANYFRDVIFVADGTAPSPSPTLGQTLLTTQVPQVLSASDGASVNYELGMKFFSASAGQIRAIRFYKATNESGAHVGKIYNSAGTLLASVSFTNETAAGWQQQDLATPVTIDANTTYVVSVNTGNTRYVATTGGMAAQIANGSLRSVVGSNGVYGRVGAMPSQSFKDSNYFRDVVFVSAAAPAPALKAPSSLKVYRVTSTLVRVDWLDNSSDESGFVVERAVGSSSAAFSQIASKAADATFHRDTHVVSGSTYCYRVKAIQGASVSSAYSNVVCAKVP